MKRIRLQGLAALQLAKHVVENRPQQVRLQRVEDLSHLRVARDLADAEQRLHVLIVATRVERQQRRVLEREHGQGRADRIGQRDGRFLMPMVGESPEGISDQFI